MSLTIALIAHDAKKPALAEWVSRHRKILGRHRIICTATTGSVIARSCPDLKLELVKSGPMGGDQQIGARIADGTVDVLIFFPDPLTPHPHDVDVKALLRLALVYDIPSAFNPRTANLLLDSGLFGSRAARDKT